MSAERFTLDANLLFYAVDATNAGKHARAIAVVERARLADCILILQAVAEFFSAVSRKTAIPVEEAGRIASGWLDLFPVVAADAADLRAAMSAPARARASFWDALLLATAGRAGCATILSEDLQDGASYGGVRVRNPFAGAAIPADIGRLLGLG